VLFLSPSFEDKALCSGKVGARDSITYCLRRRGHHVLQETLLACFVWESAAGAMTGLDLFKHAGDVYINRHSYNAQSFSYPLCFLSSAILLTTYATWLLFCRRMSTSHLPLQIDTPFSSLMQVPAKSTCSVFFHSPQGLKSHQRSKGC
jgi:hypothetical protein